MCYSKLRNAEYPTVNLFFFQEQNCHTHYWFIFIYSISNPPFPRAGSVQAQQTQQIPNYMMNIVVAFLNCLVDREPVQQEGIQGQKLPGLTCPNLTMHWGRAVLFRDGSFPPEVFYLFILLHISCPPCKRAYILPSLQV